MRRAVAALTLGLLLVAHPAAAWWRDDADCCGYDGWDGPTYDVPAWDPEPVYEPTPVYEPEPAFQQQPVFEPEPLAPAPRYEVPDLVDALVVREPVAAEPTAYERPVPEPAVFERPEVDEPPEPRVDRWQAAADAGLHRVDEVYVGSVVATSGLRTTFGTTTAEADPGTAAELIASVPTGAASGYEGVLWNERLRLSDGRYVGGDLYENFAWDGTRWRHDKYVWFQDDSELASLPVTPLPPTAIVEPPLTPPLETAPVVEIAEPRPLSEPPAPGARTPREDPLEPVAGPFAPPAQLNTPPPAPSARPRDVRAGVALAPQADALARIEVLRGRAVRLWLRAFVDGAPATVAGWRLVSGEVSAVGPLGGAGDDPFTATWEHVSPQGAPFTLVFDVSVVVSGEGVRSTPATIDVLVRSPAIVE